MAARQPILLQVSVRQPYTVCLRKPSFFETDIHRSFNKVVSKLWQSSEALRIMMPDLHGQQLVSRAEEFAADIAQWDALPGEPRTIACRKRAGNHALRCPLMPINSCQEIAMVDENRVQGGLDKAKCLFVDISDLFPRPRGASAGERGWRRRRSRRKQ